MSDDLLYHETRERPPVRRPSEAPQPLTLTGDGPATPRHLALVVAVQGGLVWLRLGDVAAFGMSPEDALWLADSLRDQARAAVLPPCRTDLDDQDGD